VWFQQPSRVEFSTHARDRCEQYGRTPTDMAEAVLTDHHRRERNQGRAGWKLVAHGTVIVYDWPADNDVLTARVVSLWPAR
jgi:hypothetical protein